MANPTITFSLNNTPDIHRVSKFIAYCELRIRDMIKLVCGIDAPFCLKSFSFNDDWDTCRVAFTLSGMSQEFVWYFSYSNYIELLETTYDKE